MTEEERQKNIAAFDIEANAPRSGWVRRGGPGPEIWEKEFAGGIVGQVEEAESGWVFYGHEAGTPETLLFNGMSSRRGWAMDGCKDCALARIQ